jgi:hypothetical protein
MELRFGGFADDVPEIHEIFPYYSTNHFSVKTA